MLVRMHSLPQTMRHLFRQEGQYTATMSAKPPITDTIQAALHYVNPDRLTCEQWAFANAEMDRQIIENDRNRGADQLAAASRILADEVVRLREKLNTQP